MKGLVICLGEVLVDHDSVIQSHYCVSLLQQKVALLRGMK